MGAAAGHVLSGVEGRTPDPSSSLSTCAFSEIAVAAREPRRADIGDRSNLSRLNRCSSRQASHASTQSSVSADTPALNDLASPATARSFESNEERDRLEVPDQVDLEVRQSVACRGTDLDRRGDRLCASRCAATLRQMIDERRVEPLLVSSSGPTRRQMNLAAEP